MQDHQRPGEGNLKRIITTAIAALGLVAVAPAAASGNHWCRQSRALSSPGSGWPILAAATVSCPFAGKVHDAYADSGMTKFWQGQVRSPVTHKRYRVTCRDPRFGSGDIHATVTCTGAKGIWLRFGSLFN
jgi:hypothetical protein